MESWADLEYEHLVIEGGVLRLEEFEEDVGDEHL